LGPRHKLKRAVYSRNAERYHCFFFNFSHWVRLSTLGTAATIGLLYQPQMIDDDCGAIGGIRIGRGN
jgi:hypothetical protein